MARKKIAKALSSIAVMAAPFLASAQEAPFGFIEHVKPSARAAVFGANVSLNGLLCGTIALAEKRDFLKDAAKCMLGGSIQYLGMEIGMYDIPAVPGIGLRVVETGTSIIDNTLAGREIFDKLQYEIGPVLFEIDTNNGDADAYWRIMPVAGFIANIAKRNSLNIEDAFSYQSFVFTTQKEAGIEGFTLGNVMAYEAGKTFIRAHEFAHVLQYARFRPADQFFPDFFKDNLHLRIGEDSLVGLMNLPMLFCSAAQEKNCSRRWWNLMEAEAYSMETADKNYTQENGFSPIK